MQTAFRITLRSAHLSSRNLSSVASESLSTVHRGTAFEELSLRLLHEHLSMSLRRVGGKNDGGIDLQGWWWLPSSGSSSTSPTRIRILAQCKAEKRKYGPKYVREMEGVLHRYLNVDSDPVVGLLISSSLFTKAALLRAHSSSAPLILLHIPLGENDIALLQNSYTDALSPNADSRNVDKGLHAVSCNTHSSPPEDHTASLGSLIFNQALGSHAGILRGVLEPRWEYNSSSTFGGRPGLWLNGRRLTSWIPEADSHI